MSQISLPGTRPAPEFDDSWFEESGSRWRGRAVAAGIALIVMIAAGAAVWNWLLRSDGEAATTDTIVEAQLGTITDAIDASGTVASQSETSLNFAASGEVESVNVTLGQEVKQGDVLATVDAPELESAVRRAEISLLSAQLKLNDLTDGGDAAELAQADESYQRALAAYELASETLADLRDGPDQREIATGQQQVVDAEAALAKSEAARASLDTTADDGADAAQSAVDKAETTLDNARDSEDDAEAAVNVADAQLRGAQAAYCPDGAVSFCGSSKVPLPSSDKSILKSVAASGDVTRAPLASAVLDASTTYDQRATALDAAQDAVTAAEAALEDAEDALSDVQAGPSAADIKSADAAVSSARLALDQARADLADLLDGADASEIRAAELDLASADSALTSAEVQRAKTYDGADADEISDQRGSVELADMSLAEAKLALEDAQLIAPFDGTVADVNIAAGDEAGAAADGAAIILNTPDALRVELAVNESDLAALKVGQAGTATFDQLDGAAFPITIEAIGTNPTTTQGVVTYEVIASLDLTRRAVTIGNLPEGFSIPEGFTPPEGFEIPEGFTPGQGGQLPEGFEPPEGVELPEGFTPGSGQVVEIGEQAMPKPGMSASISITIEEQSDVIVVPTNAIQREGPQQVVEVERENGERERVPVQTGLSNGTQTAITEGLEGGEQVVVPAATSTSGGGAPTGGFGFSVPAGGGGGGPGIIISGGGE